jgi:hypothetical protein
VRKAWSDAARAAEVRDAARAWRESEAIDAATLEAIAAAYPEPRPPLSAAWRALVFFLVTVAIQAVFWGVVEVTHTGFREALLVFGVALAVATELLRGSRFAGNGSDAAASFWAIVYLLVGVAERGIGYRRDEEALITLVLVVATVLFGAACARWGFAAYGAFAAIALFGLIGRFPHGRAGWILLALALLALAFRNLDRAALAPPHRAAAAWIFAVAAIALYTAANRWSLDHDWIELLRSHGPQAGPHAGTIVFLSTAATALLPPAFIVWGIRARRALILDLGLVFAAASLVTLRFYVHLAPLWVLLTLAGGALLLGSLWVARWLRRGPAGERGGFTAAPLFGSRRGEALQAAAVVAGFTGPPSPHPAPASGELTPGGGRFGGGGASGEF